jgi:hypothetical protein
MRWLLAILMGAGLGIASAVADADVALHPESNLRALGMITDTVSIWVLAAVLGGWLLARKPWTALGGLVVLASGFVAWFVYLASRPGGSFDLGALGPEPRAWAIAGLVVGPLFGLLGGVSRSSSIVGVCARISAPVALVAEIVMRHRITTQEFSVDPTLAWTSVVLLIAGLLMAAIGVVGPQRSSTSQ